MHRLIKALFFNLFRFGIVEEGGGGSAAPTVAPEVQALIDSAVAGLKNKNSEILGSLKATKEQLARFEGIDPDAMKALLSKFSEDEDAALIKRSLR